MWQAVLKVLPSDLQGFVSFKLLIFSLLKPLTWPANLEKKKPVVSNIIDRAASVTLFALLRKRVAP